MTCLIDLSSIQQILLHILCSIAVYIVYQILYRYVYYRLRLSIASLIMLDRLCDMVSLLCVIGRQLEEKVYANDD